MLERYTRPEMGNIWTEENKYRAWLEVEILADEAWAELGEIPQEDVKKIREHASFDIDRILEIEKLTRHDVVAFTRAVSETLGEERKWVHYGLTSTDVVDTAYGYLIKQANDILREDLKRFTEIIGEKAKEHKYTVMMGRTHGVHAEPTTFGLKLATWYSEMKRNIERFEHAAKGVEAGKISGAVGTFANIPPFIEEYVCKQLGIRPQEISTQVLPRDLHAEYFSAMALIATSIERFATEIRGLQKSETREVEEFFAKGQKGSSAMPHKVNPIDFENAEGNLGMANAILTHLATKLPISRLQRDLTDSTVLRNVGVPMAHVEIAFKSLTKGLGKLLLNEKALYRDLDNCWAVVAEGIQTILRREGYPKPYEALKALTRTNEGITAESISNFIDTLQVSDAVKAELKAITPHNYTGI